MPCLIRRNKKYYEKDKKNDWTFRVKIQVIKSAILLSFYKVARPQMFLIINATLHNLLVLRLAIK